MRKLFNLLFQKKYLLATNTVSSGILMLIGDGASQVLENRQLKNGEDRLDRERLGEINYCLSWFISSCYPFLVCSQAECHLLGFHRGYYIITCTNGWTL
jgi:hypothetical protein